MSPARSMALALVFLIFLAGAGVAFWNAFDSIALAIAPTILVAAAITAAFYFLTGGRRKSSL